MLISHQGLSGRRLASLVFRKQLINPSLFSALFLLSKVDFLFRQTLGSLLVYSISVLARQPARGCIVSESFCLQQVYSAVKNIPLRQILSEFCLFFQRPLLIFGNCKACNTNIYSCPLKIHINNVWNPELWINSLMQQYRLKTSETFG